MQKTKKGLSGNRTVDREEASRKVPEHIAIILDGNGRWAKKRGLPRTAGHAAGAETFRKIASYAKSIGVKYLTVYAFSTENWKRAEEEVSSIMNLLDKYLQEAIEKMEAEQVRFRFFGDTTRLSENLRSEIRRVEEKSAHMDGVQVNMCLNYGARDEIVRAAKAYAEDCLSGKAAPEALNEELFSDYLYSHHIPDPDLLIRPGGELRLSNFLLWQCAYSEFYFTDVLWPDFTPEDLDRAIDAFNGRSRRFGGVV